MKKITTAILALVFLAGCTQVQGLWGKVSSNPQTVETAASFGCASMAKADQETAKKILAELNDTLAKQGPAAFADQVTAFAKEDPSLKVMNVLWLAVQIYNTAATPADWQVQAEAVLQAAVKGCQAGLS